MMILFFYYKIIININSQFIIDINNIVLITLISKYKNINYTIIIFMVFTHH